jgi:hypothetical protein
MLKIDFTYTGGVPGSRGLPRRRYNALRKLALEAVGHFWHEHYRALHFTAEGAKKYGYAPRSGHGRSGKKFWQSYTGRKLKAKHHRRPLVWSGKSEELSKRRTFAITSKRDLAILRIKIPAPALNFKNPHSDIDMRKEMETVTADEMAAMSKVYVERLAELIHEETAVVRVGFGGGSVAGEIAGGLAMGT